MQALEHQNGQSTGSDSEASYCSVLKMEMDVETIETGVNTTTQTVNIESIKNTTVETTTIDNIEITAEAATGGRIATGTDSSRERESSRPATATSTTTTIIDTTPNTANTTEGVDTAGVQDGDPSNFSGSTSAPAHANTNTSTSSGTGTADTTRDTSLNSSPLDSASLPLLSPLSPFAFAFGSATASASDSSSSPPPTSTSTFPSSFILAKAPPPKKYARLPPPIQIGGKLRNSTTFLLSPSPPQSALLSPSSGTLFSSPSTSSDSPSSSLFTSAASAPDTRASSSSSSRTLTTTANAGLHNNDDHDHDDNNTSTFFHGPSDSITSPVSPVLTAWPDHIDVVNSDNNDNRDDNNDTATSSSLPKKSIRSSTHSRSLSAGHSSITMTAATATRNATASDNFLRASSSSHGNSNNHNNNSRWRPTSAKSARSADRSRRRSPSPLFNPFARVSRHRHNDNEDASNNHNHAMRASTSNGRRPSYSRRGSLSSGAAPPPLTREEFEALPLAIQRKYFSTLERLRFAQGSGTIDGIYQHYDAISAQNIQRRRARQDRIASDNITTRLRKRSLRLESSSLLSHNHGPSPAIGDAVADTLFYANLPDKIKKREFTREEQVKLAGQLRASVILDAADEAIYKIGRRSSITHRLIAPDITVDTPTTTSFSFRHSMETIHSSSDPRLGLGRGGRDALGLEDATAAKRISGVPESFYDSFRWLEEDDDLDLSLMLDDYHSNLRDALPSPNKERGPSFRRHLSISKMPFSRPLPQSTSVGSNLSNSNSNSNSNSSRPATKDDVASTCTARSPSITGNGNNMTTPFPSMPSSTFSSPTGAGSHLRRKSRTLSLITPKHHAVHDSISSIDPGAAHYQDPEARLKLRVYLASPQKFDEAIEFGFPSTEVLSSMSTTGGSPPMGSSSILSSTNTKGNCVSTATTAVEKRHIRRATRQSTSDGTSNGTSNGTMRTFLADDDDDENEGVPADADMTKPDSDQASVPDPESPKTPNLVDSVGTGTSSRKTSSSAFRPYRLSTSTDSPQHGGGHRPSDSYAQVPASSREMTLRMTLTRLDLRAGEEQIYGWQQKKQYHVHHQSSSHNLIQGSNHNHIRKSSTATALGAVGPHYPPTRKDSLLLPSSSNNTTTATTTTTTTTTSTSTCDSTVTYLGAGAVSRPKASIEDVFAGIDHWEADQDKGVMKRFWNRVRRS